MKSLLLTLSLATAAISTAQAEYYRPSVVRDTTVLGAVAGALIGGHNNDHWARGAVIGAAAGAIIGSAVDRSRPVVYQEREIRPVSVVPYAPVVGSYSRDFAYVESAPRVVYVQPAPRVVYVESYRRPWIVERPVVYVSDHRSYGYDRHRHRHGGWRDCDDPSRW